MLEGMHYGWSSPSLPKLLQNGSAINTTQEEALLIAQMFVYGSMTSTIAAVIKYPHLNQKLTLLLSIFVMTLSWVLIGTAWSAKLLMIARFFAGVGRFLVYLVSTDYICEIAAPNIRGILASMIYIMMNLGLLIVYSLGPSITVVHFALIGAIISLSELVAIKWVPESPYVLISEGKIQTARKVLKSLRSRWNIEEELDNITSAVQRQDKENNQYWNWILVKSNRKAVIILSLLHAFQVLSGVNMSIHHILKPGGGNNESYNLAVLTSVSGVVSCSISAFLLDYVGRKPILITSFFLSGIIIFIYGLYIYMEQVLEMNMKPFSSVPFSCLLLYTMVYRMGIGMIPLLISGEIFPMNVKNISAAYCGIFTIIVSFISIGSISFVKNYYGEHVLFWCYTVICILGILFTYKYVPETKGLSLEEIQWKLK